MTAASLTKPTTTTTTSNHHHKKRKPSKLRSRDNASSTLSANLAQELGEFMDYDDSNAKDMQYLKDLQEEQDIHQKLDEEEQMEMEEEEAEEIFEKKKAAVTLRRSKKGLPYKDRLLLKIFHEKETYNIEWFNSQCKRIDASLPTRQKMEKFMLLWSLWLQKLDRTKRYDDMMDFFTSYSNQAPKVRAGLNRAYRRMHPDQGEEEDGMLDEDAPHDTEFAVDQEEEVTAEENAQIVENKHNAHTPDDDEIEELLRRCGEGLETDDAPAPKAKTQKAVVKPKSSSRSRLRSKEKRPEPASDDEDEIAYDDE